MGAESDAEDATRVLPGVEAPEAILGPLLIVDPIALPARLDAVDDAPNKLLTRSPPAPIPEKSWI
jgi:hypothetical protein